MSVTNFVQKLIGIENEDYDGFDPDYQVIEPTTDDNPNYEASPAAPPQYRDRVRASQADRKSPPVSPKKLINDKVVGLPNINNGNAEVMVIEPQSFEEMPNVINALRERKSVVLNLDKMDPQEAQRSVDFVAGGTYAMDGHNERVGDSIFLFTPSCVTVSNLAGLISSADDFSNVRPRTPANRPVDPWNEQPTAIAQ
jgi:cell division inhibitor SepF